MIMSSRLLRGSIIAAGILTTLAVSALVYFSLENNDSETAQKKTTSVVPQAPASDKPSAAPPNYSAPPLISPTIPEVAPERSADQPVDPSSDADSGGAPIAATLPTPTETPLPEISPSHGSSIAPSKPITHSYVDGDRIAWEPIDGEYAFAQLRVSGPGIQPFDINFAENEEIAFPLSGDAGNTWQDGLYTWELRTAPKVSASDREMMAEIREVVTTSNADEVLRYNGVHIEPGQTVTGNFRIADGEAMIPTDDLEPEPVEEPVALAADTSASTKSDSVASVSSDDLGLASVTDDIQLRDHVILDDCIIDGSMCVGLDCVNGENFGFDTIRLKENNLRLHFDDTSVAAAFPPNDWRIIINDSANGGDSYFAIEDVTGGRIPFRIAAGARNHALFVDSQGDVGIGTSTPATDIHIAIGDTPTVRLEQNGTSGWNPHDLTPEK